MANPTNLNEKIVINNGTCTNCKSSFTYLRQGRKRPSPKYCSVECKPKRSLSKESRDKISKSNLNRYNAGEIFGFQDGHFDLVPISSRKNQASAIKGSRHYLWKQNREELGYMAKHQWMIKNFGQPKTCEHCQRTDLSGHKIHWANVSNQYKLARTDWLRLCVSCHKLFDLSKKLYGSN